MCRDQQKSLLFMSLCSSMGEIKSHNSIYISSDSHQLFFSNWKEFQTPCNSKSMQHLMTIIAALVLHTSNTECRCPAKDSRYLPALQAPLEKLSWILILALCWPATNRTHTLAGLSAMLNNSKSSVQTRPTVTATEWHCWAKHRGSSLRALNSWHMTLTLSISTYLENLYESGRTREVIVSRRSILREPLLSSAPKLCGLCCSSGFI